VSFDPSKLPAFGEGGWFWLTKEGTEASRQLAEYRGQASEDIAAAYRAIFSTTQGRLVLADLHALTLAQPTWVPGVPDPVMAGYAREGQNSVTRYILDKLNSGQPVGSYSQPLFPEEARNDQSERNAGGSQQAAPEQGGTGRDAANASAAGDAAGGDDEQRPRRNPIPAGDKPAGRAKRSDKLGGILDGSARPGRKR
jgi:hypothetical protein